MRDGTWRRFTGSAGIAGTTSRIALANAETAAASTFTAIRTPGLEPPANAQADSTYTRNVKGLRSVVRAASVLLIVALLSTSCEDAAQQPRVERSVDDFMGSFSPNGKMIVFERFFSTQRGGVDTHPVARRAVLLLMEADGSSKRVLRHTGASFEYDATYSPDGRSILFIRDERIHLMRRDGHAAHPVRRDVLEQACPRFSPDGSKIALWRGSATGGGYYVMNADGSRLRRISSRQHFAWGCPSWFPDGKHVVFTKDYSLYVASVDSTNVERITDDKDGTLYRPSVSPDGRWIACDGFARNGYGIIVLRADGTAMTRITTAVAGDIANDAGASWSPDGKQIAFSGYRGRFNGAGVYMVNRDGRALRRLSNFAR
jgi:Tol biopolymer transport system component